MPAPTSDYDHLIPPEVKGDPFYAAILELARTEKLRHVLEIGSSSGEGSTEAFVRGLRDNPHRPTLFCMELSKPRFEALRDRYAREGFVRAYRVSSVPAERFPSEETVTQFYQSHLAGRFVPLAEYLRWLRQDLDYIRGADVPTEGIRQIREENAIDRFDLVLIDGSEFSGEAELEEVYGARFLLLDDIVTYKNHANYRRLLADPNYVRREASEQVRGGYAIFERVLNDGTASAALRTPVADFLRTAVRPGMKVVDLPSARGEITVLLSRLVRREGKVIAFAGEPLRSFCAEQGCENVEVVPLDAPTGGPDGEWLRAQLRERGPGGVDVLRIETAPLTAAALDAVLDLQISGAVRQVIIDAGADETPLSESALQRLAARGLQAARVQADGRVGAAVAAGETPAGPLLVRPILPVNFFTIVLNGLPYLRHHIEQMKQLPFDWHWHIVEGVAELKHDTAWSVPNGGRIPEEFHRDGRSVDGTTEYLDQLAAEHPERVTLYRKPPGQRWEGKLEMVSAPLANLGDECVLWEIDADELWTAAQWIRGRQLFLEQPEKTAAMYWCWFFVGPDLITTTRLCYANNPQGEWLRTWRFRPGMRWLAHEPPLLAEPLAHGQWRSVAPVNPFLHAETEAAGLVFQHFAYATESQVRFKETYYAYHGAVERWRALNAATSFPVNLRDYFPWVGDATRVGPCRKYVPHKLIELPPVAPPGAAASASAPVGIRGGDREPLVVVDGVFFQFCRTGIARVWGSLLLTWVRDGFAKNVVVLDRANTAPKFPGVRYRPVEAFDYARTEADRAMLQRVCDEEGASVFISSYYTFPITTPSVFMLYDMIPELFSWDLSHPMWQEKHRAIGHASLFVSISEQSRVDLLKFYPQLRPESIQVTPLACSEVFRPRSVEEVAAVRQASGTHRPYFLTVGSRGGYKNTILTFRALGRFPRLNEFDLLCAGHTTLEPEFQECIGTKPAHTFNLSDDHLAAAYTGAVALLHPSAYEGFGLPVLEAMSCGCPVITTRNGSLAEVAGDAALFVKDDDVDGMVAALHEVLVPEVRERLIRAGFAQAARFSWQRTADGVRAALLQVARERREKGAD